MKRAIWKARENKRHACNWTSRSVRIKSPVRVTNRLNMDRKVAFASQCPDEVMQKWGRLSGKQAMEARQRNGQGCFICRGFVQNVISSVFLSGDVCVLLSMLPAPSSEQAPAYPGKPIQASVCTCTDATGIPFFRMTEWSTNLLQRRLEALTED